MNIPIKNVYYLVLYAFDQVKNKSDIVDKDFESIKDFDEVIVDLFIKEVNKIIKKGVYRDYNTSNDELSLIKGKIKINESSLLKNGKKVCEYDDFNSINQHNEILKFIVNRLLFTKGLSKKLKSKLKTIYFTFNEIELKEFTVSDFRKVDFNKLNYNYEFPIKLASYIISNTIPSEDEGSYKFIDILKDEEQMNIIFEKFLLNFYRLNTDYRVKGSKMYSWYFNSYSDDLNSIPKMKTDIELIKKDNKIIIDAKYYTDAFTNSYNTNKHRSGHMYQINAYLDHNVGIFKNLRGILIYPTNGYNFNEKFYNEKFSIEFATVDLSLEWKDIEQRLIDIVS